jgi:hypothetical protein
MPVDQLNDLLLARRHFARQREISSKQFIYSSSKLGVLAPLRAILRVSLSAPAILSKSPHPDIENSHTERNRQ